MLLHMLERVGRISRHFKAVKSSLSHKLMESQFSQRRAATLAEKHRQQSSATVEQIENPLSVYETREHLVNHLNDVLLEHWVCSTSLPPPPSEATHVAAAAVAASLEDTIALGCRTASIVGKLADAALLARAAVVAGVPGEVVAGALAALKTPLTERITDQEQVMNLEF